MVYQSQNYKPKVVRNGIGVLTVIGIVFVILKTIKVIDWSWWIVLLPFYGPFVPAVFILLFGILLVVNKRRRNARSE